MIRSTRKAQWTNKLAPCVNVIPIRKSPAGRYDSTMNRLLAVLSSALVVTGGVCPPGNANAAPPDAEGQCSFVLETPKVVQVSGVDFVMAAAHPGPCTLEMSPNRTTVCVSIVGDDSQGQCRSVNGPRTAVVYYTYRPGATYVVKGRGCANGFTPPYTTCQDIPASRLTL